MTKRKRKPTLVELEHAERQAFVFLKSTASDPDGMMGFADTLHDDDIHEVEYAADQLMQFGFNLSADAEGWLNARRDLDEARATAAKKKAA